MSHTGGSSTSGPRPAGEHPDDKRKPEIPAAWIGAAATILAAVIAGAITLYVGVFHDRAPIRPSPPASRSSQSLGQTGSAGQPTSAGKPTASPATSAAPIDFKGQVRLAYGVYLNLDANPPGPSGGPGQLIFNTSGPGISTPESLSTLNGAYVSVYSPAPPVTEGQCKIWAQTHADTQTPTLYAGNRLCFSTAQHRTIYAQVTAIDSPPTGNSGRIMLNMTIWGP